MKMTQTSRMNLNVFYGHQFHSPVEDSPKIRDAVRKAVERVEKSWNERNSGRAIKMTYEQIDIDSGQDLFSAVIKAIDDASICIFNLTEKNHNVIFELGHAHGRDKELIWLFNEKATLTELPSDFQGRFMLRYASPDALADKLENALEQRIDRLWGLNFGQIAFDEIWDLAGFENIDMIFGKIQGEASLGNSVDEPNYLRYQALADIDTLVYFTQLLSRNFPRLVRKDWISQEFTESSYPRIVVGGPALNDYAGQYYRRETKGIGAAMLPVQFATQPATGEEYVKISESGESREYYVQADDGQGFMTDVGIFAKFADPIRNTPVYIVSGIQTIGVLGAAKCFGDGDQGLSNCDFVRRRDPDLHEFLAVFEVRARRTVNQIYAETPSLYTQLLYLDALS